MKELAKEVDKPLLIIFEVSWQSSEAPTDRKIGNIVVIFQKRKMKEPGNHRLVSLTSGPGKIMAQICLETMLRQKENKKMVGDSQLC